MAHVPDGAVLGKVVRLKREQYQGTGVTCTLEAEWVTQVIERIHATQSGGFAGMLSALYLEDEIVAAQMRLRSRAELAVRIMVYDPRFGRYSPGTILALELAKNAESLGIQCIDLGTDITPWKQSLMTSTKRCGYGRVEIRRHLCRVSDVGHRMMRWLRRSRVLVPYRAARRVFRQTNQRFAGQSLP